MNKEGVLYIQKGVLFSHIQSYSFLISKNVDSEKCSGRLNFKDQTQEQMVKYISALILLAEETAFYLSYYPLRNLANTLFS